MSAIETDFEGRVSERLTLHLPVRRVFGLILGWYQLHKSRVELSGLTDEQLNDIGLTAQEALREADRPFWDGHQVPDR